MIVFDKHESNVRTYSRSFPVVFDRARGAEVFARDGRRYLDFFAGAGALNYGHNDERLRDVLVDYLDSSRIVHSLDLMTVEKGAFIELLQERVLAPRGLDYKVQFTGPTGTNCVEAALKLARRVTGRPNVVSFTNGFHGMTLGALAVTGNRSKRAGAGVPLGNVQVIPYDGYVDSAPGDVTLFERLLDDPSSGVDLPAAVILETVQAEGGVNVASALWLQRIASLCRRRGVLLIVDDIQVGCGRTGPFFSFERAGIVPDIVCLSKSLSGYGLPLALLLLKPDIDVWRPGEHNGTFRGFNLAFATARRAIEVFWSDARLTESVARHESLVRDALGRMAARVPEGRAQVRGLGLIWGLELPRGLAPRVSYHAFRRGLVVETSGASDQVVKLLPPLTIGEGELREGLALLGDAVDAAVAEAPARRAREGVA